MVLSLYTYVDISLFPLCWERGPGQFIGPTKGSTFDVGLYV